MASEWETESALQSWEKQLFPIPWSILHPPCISSTMLVGEHDLIWVTKFKFNVATNFGRVKQIFSLDGS